MNLKKIVLIVILVVILLLGGIAIFKGGKKEENSNDNLQIVVSNFASYDFLRAIIGDNSNVELTFLLGPGKDTHSYEPTAQDLIKLQNADLFVYIGGEAEAWSDKIIETLEFQKTKIICIADYVDKLDEEEIDGAEPEDEEEEEVGAFDEHIWTSPKNAIKMVEALEKEMAELDNQNSEKYNENAQNYIAQIEEVDNKIQETVDNKVRNRLIFADKMPMQYFVNYYGLEVSAAFSGCSTETEPSASTIAYLENKVKEENIPVVLYIELNDGRVAKTIAGEAGEYCQAMQIQTLHNISKDDFDNGETWVSLMTRNIDVLKKALW